MLGAIIIGIPLLIYIVGALSVARRDLSHPDDFFVAYKKVGVTAFSSSSIAYAFQVSTVYPFLLWGASNFYFVPAVNTLCWGLGILLFYLCFNRYKQFIGQDLTLHGFLGKQYGVSVRVVASYLTVIGFLGFAIAETYFGSKVLLTVVENKNVFYAIVALTLLFVFSYIAYGGQLSSIRTDQLQLIISYVGIFGIMLYFFYLLLVNGASTSGALSFSFLILLIYIPIILIIRKFRFIKFSEEDTKTNRVINQILNTAICSLLILILCVAIYKVVLQRDFKPSVSNLINLEGFGIPGLLTLAVLPLCWQFVDLTNWQRLLAVKADREENAENLHLNIRKGLLIYAIESPFTWMIFLFFGLLAVTALPHFTVTDLLIDIPKQLITSGGFVQHLVGYVFIVSVLAIMLSTVDSFIVGIIFTFVYDSYGKTRRLLDSENDEQKGSNYSKITNAGRIFGLVALLLGIMFFIFFDKHVANGGELFINLLLAFYSAQLSFFPLIFGILFLKKHPNAFWANASMIAGAVIGIAVGVYAVMWKPAYAWYPVLACTVLSSLIYLFGWLISNNPNVRGGLRRFWHYVETNEVSIGLLLLFVFLSTTRMCWCNWGMRRERYKNWETCALLFTFTYTIYLYVKNRKKFKNVMGWPAMFLGVAPLALMFTTIISASGHLEVGGVRVEIHRPEIMVALVVTSLLFVVVDLILFRSLKAKYPKDSNAFWLSFQYSDFPILVAFILLTIYAFALGEDEIKRDHMDAFFAGAIAFQMILSNIIWTVTDDPLVEPGSGLDNGSVER